MSFVVITEWLLYLSFSIIMGMALLYNVGPQYRASATLSRRLMLLGTLGAILFSYAPVLSAILIFGSDIGYWQSFTAVMLTFELGKAWYIILVSGILLLGLIYFNDIDQDPFLGKLAVLLVTVMIIGYAKASHAASLQPVTGFISHFTHLWFISIWGGILFIVAWRAPNPDQWPEFIRWFTPLAIGSIFIILISGFMTMAIDFQSPTGGLIKDVGKQYINGLSVNYGQALLIKHLFIIPLILFAAFNGFYTRYQLKRGFSFPALSLARLESLFLVIIFFITAFMGQQAPPHDVVSLIKQEGISPMFLFFYPSAAATIIPLHFGWTEMSLLFLFIGIGMAVLIVYLVIKRLSKIGSMILSIGLIFSLYTSVMVSLH